MSEPPKPDEDARCDRCGAFSALDLGDRRLCEFGADDLWRRDEPGGP